jgi:DNA helicase IV
MTDENKKILLNNAKNHVESIRNKVKNETERITSLNTKELHQVAKDDQAVFFQVKFGLDKRTDELTTLYGSPYFVKCKIKFENSEKAEDVYFAKFEFIDNSIYSWITPIASIRFENPGKTSYRLPDGRIKNVELLSKEQYMIVDGEIIFQTSESQDYSRELIYQKHFSEKKKGFMLPEIIAQMEKAQDQVIRAHHKGPFVISGPAGSGKTTLAFHRVAYLVQSPDTAENYPTESIMLLVQDKGAIDYFSHLLPELGINNIKINSFNDWLMEILNIVNIVFISDYSEIDINNNQYEQEKLLLLRNKKTPEYKKSALQSLDSFYSKALSNDSYLNFKKQKSKKVLDRLDLMLLLNAYIKKNKYIKIKGRKEPFLYSMILVDEFQNYLPEQLDFIKSVINKETESVIYVGDMKQQVNIGTIKDWSQINESIPEERNIVLNKVYRNTKQILNYIRELGFSITIPEGIKEGPAVTEEVFVNSDDQIEYVRAIIEKNESSTIGVISKHASDLKKFESLSIKRDNVHLVSMIKSQSLEFDIVIVVDIDTHFEDSDTGENPWFNERKTIQKDSLYIALTRAMTELHIIGSVSLKEKLNATI